MSSHAEHLGRHIERLGDSFGHDRRREVVELCGLGFDGNQLSTNTGENIAEAHCRDYLVILENRFGEEYTALVRFNFELAGCCGGKAA